MSKSTISTFELFQMFPDQESARLYLESRLWPDGVTCPTCRKSERITNGSSCEVNLLIATLANELKEYREFVGAIDSNLTIGEIYGRWQRDNTFVFFDNDDDAIATGTDPFDAWRNLRNQELSEVESEDA